MSRTIEPVPDALIFDTDQRCSLAQLRALRAVGFRGGVRTVTFSEATDPSDLTAQEVDDFMAAGLGLMVYQRVRYPGWLPSGALGAADAGVALAKVAAAGYLAGGSLWGDLEGIGGTGSATVEYANTKDRAIAGGGYHPGEYVGFEVPLTGQDLFRSLLADCYWKSFSHVPDVEERGYAIEQIAENVLVAGVLVDVSVARADKLNGRARWMRDSA
jgi:glycoside hydrolase-like protein